MGTPKVLRSKYGRLYVQFGRILDFDELIELPFAGHPTVGVGHLVTPKDGLRVGDRVSHERVLDFLDRDRRGDGSSQASRSYRPTCRMRVVLLPQFGRCGGSYRRAIPTTRLGARERYARRR